MLLWIGLIGYRTRNKEGVRFAELEGVPGLPQKLRYRFLPGAR
jgi:hypothetical protein